MKRPTTPQLLAATVLIVLAVGGIGYTLWNHNSSSLSAFPQDKLAAGLALSPDSSAKITVLKAPVPTESGTPVTQSDELLPSSSHVSLIDGNAKPAAAATPTPTQVPAPVFNPNAARLGTTLSLLLSTWDQGGALPHQLANTASQLAEKTGQPALIAAAKDLRRVTPREGPLTQPLLLVETSKALALKAPADLPVTNEQAEAEKSWFRRQLELLIQIDSKVASQNNWDAAMLTVQQFIARGAITDAANMLDETPLRQDNRLSSLREQVRTYLMQRGRLNHAVTTYANTFLMTEDSNE
jgi:hypothetical protein